MRVTLPSNGEDDKQTKVRHLYVCLCRGACVCATVVGRMKRCADERRSSPLFSPLFDALFPLVRSSN